MTWDEREVDHPKELSTEDLTNLGPYDPAGPDVADRLELLRYGDSDGSTSISTRPRR